MKHEINITLQFNEDWDESFDGSIVPELIVDDAIRELASGVTYTLTHPASDTGEQ